MPNRIENNKNNKRRNKFYFYSSFILNSFLCINECNTFEIKIMSLYNRICVGLKNKGLRSLESIFMLVVYMQVLMLSNYDDDDCCSRVINFTGRKGEDVDRAYDANVSRMMLNRKNIWHIARRKSFDF